MVGCVRSYPSCYSVQYKEDTGHCTPGSWMVKDATQPTLSGIYTVDTLCSGFLKFDVLQLNGYPLTACVMMSRDKLTYREAQDYCKTTGAHLYTPTTPEELSLLSQFGLKEMVWMGLDDIRDEDTFRWADNDATLTRDLRAQLFKAGEPDNKTPGEDCVILSPDDKLLMDTKCDEQLRYFCELTPIVELT
ncbi:unnamed protein product [Lymnaea stagnalis]|uniref:C-type lectin domain-containing protein n=1 Tax=Lymnaea stagnalis TaxID=6523 RepID=A0AAV2GXA3_LYMST